MSAGSHVVLMRAAVILAAGQASRMGRQKLLLRWQGHRLIEYPVAAALGVEPGYPAGGRPPAENTGSKGQTLHDQVVVVTGASRPAVESALSVYPIKTVYNPVFAGGMAGSLACGIEALNDACSGVLVLLGDQPAVRSGDLQRLWEAFDQVETPAPIVFFQNEKGKVGIEPGKAEIQPPVIFHRRYFKEMLAMSDDRGAKPVILAHRPAWVRVKPPSEPWAHDIDTPGDYERLRGQNDDGPV